MKNKRVNNKIRVPLKFDIFHENISSSPISIKSDYSFVATDYLRDIYSVRASYCEFKLKLTSITLPVYKPYTYSS